MLDTLEEKTEAMRDVFRFMRDFDDVPKHTDPGSEQFWQDCANRMTEVSNRWGNDLLITKMLIAVWEDHEAKAHIRTVMNK